MAFLLREGTWRKAGSRAQKWCSDVFSFTLSSLALYLYTSIHFSNRGSQGWGETGMEPDMGEEGERPGEGQFGGHGQHGDGWNGPRLTSLEPRVEVTEVN